MVHLVASWTSGPIARQQYGLNEARVNDSGRRGGDSQLVLQFSYNSSFQQYANRQSRKHGQNSQSQLNSFSNGGQHSHNGGVQPQ